MESIFLYGICSIISKLFSFCSQKMVIIPGIHKILVGIANMKDHDQTASDLGLCCLSICFPDRATSIQNRRTSTICVLLFKDYYFKFYY